MTNESEGSVTEIEARNKVVQNLERVTMKLVLDIGRSIIVV